MSESRHKHWCFTINNYAAADIERLRTLGGTVQYLVFGREVSSSGTPHLQGFASFGSPVRFSTVRRRVGETAHLEVARGTTDQAADYCVKDGDYEEFGTRPVSNQGKRSDLDAFFEWSASFAADKKRPPSTPECARQAPALYTKYPGIVTTSRLCFEGSQLETAEPKDWQDRLQQELDEEPVNNRAILFYVDDDGATGKSWFARWYYSRNRDRVQILSVGKRDDLAHAIKPSKSVFLFNVPRGQMEFLQYSVLEQLKDRLVFSPKYNSQTKELISPTHVVVFCNEEPDYTKMTEDRYVIRRGPNFDE